MTDMKLVDCLVIRNRIRDNRSEWRGEVGRVEGVERMVKRQKRTVDNDTQRHKTNFILMNSLF